MIRVEDRQNLTLQVSEAHAAGAQPAKPRPSMCERCNAGKPAKACSAGDSPARIVPMLADEGRYLASESSFHRVLKAQGQMRHCGRARALSKSRQPTTHKQQRGTGPVLGRDLAAEPGYRSLVLPVPDLQICATAKSLAMKCMPQKPLITPPSWSSGPALAEGIHAQTQRPVLHGDNGAALKATTVLAMLYWLGCTVVLATPRIRRQRLRRVAVSHR